jgi:aubergine
MTEQLKIDDGGGDKVKQAEEAENIVPEAPKEPILKHGSKGQKFSAISNSIMIDCEKDYGMFEYDVRFNPPLDDMRSRKVTLRQMADTIGTIFNYDGGETLYLPIQLQSQVVTKTVEGTTAKLSFRRQRSLSECTHFYNVLFDRIMYELKFERIGRKYFDPIAPKLIPQHKLQVWPGYVKVVEELEGNSGLNLIIVI